MNSSNFLNTNFNLVPNSAEITSLSGATGGMIFATQAAAAPIIFVTGGTAFTNERMRIDNAGNVGIATSAPNAYLDINYGGGIALLLGGDTGATTRTNNTVKVARVGLIPYASATNIPTNILDTYIDGGVAEIHYGGSTTLMNAATTHMFFTASNTTTTAGTERMRITSSGNIGINSTVPQAKLDVEGSVYVGNGNVGIGVASPGAPLVFAQSTGDKIRLFDPGAAGRYGMGVQNSELQFYMPSSALNHFSFNRGGDLQSVGTNEIMRIDANTGNVGINSFAPTAKLDVEGSAYFGNGNIGVGSAVPSQKIDVLGTVKATAFIGDGSSLSGLGATAWGTSGSNVYLTTASNNVGIGTSTPSGKLVVYGGNVGIGSTVPATRLDLVGSGTTSATTSVIIRASDATPRVTMFDNGNVGIGSTVPAAMVDIVSTNANAINYFGSNVGIGTSVPPVLLSVQSGVDTNVLELKDANGTCDHNPGASSETVTCSSDARLKERIRDAAPAIPEIMKFKVRDFIVKATGEERTGVVAQELLPVLPKMVAKGADGYYQVAEPDPWKIIKAIQELKAENDILRADVESLKQLRAANEAVNNKGRELEIESKSFQLEIEALRAIVCRDHPEEPVCRKKTSAVSPAVRRDLSLEQKK
jgi:hypothetical protein